MPLGKCLLLYHEKWLKYSKNTMATTWNLLSADLIERCIENIAEILKKWTWKQSMSDRKFALYTPEHREPSKISINGICYFVYVLERIIFESPRETWVNDFLRKKKSFMGKRLTNTKRGAWSEGTKERHPCYSFTWQPGSRSQMGTNAERCHSRHYFYKK